MRTILFLAVVLLVACDANPDEALRALEAQGMTQVTLGGYPFYVCGEGDDFNSSFTARGVNGQRVEGAVCCGALKGCTVRFK